ncbi:hypothetical protein PF010_g26943 [Phytophthora fragariae]|uniref:Uncharacterized protein n=2 Tax=Phytophthora TaxID=4783 RepID=A0A6A3QSI5_9STRA|nr:hypothetical protein PF003_g10988 [Phytophthora fragariae]KAE8971156.1 hypothetical protein PR002_g26915 [Phytophthora rubi]KAE8921722.1 hypothetical protein PF009_g28004 [Phytophthora fragariae]KAE8970692.1 hypothetical protein PF011_g26324 [Phytophthora fragariae]KAE9068746.1 hypothetical protein PF010_g26943 [Phytophthora fragariae]
MSVRLHKLQTESAKPTYGLHLRKKKSKLGENMNAFGVSQLSAVTVM